MQGLSSAAGGSSCAMVSGVMADFIRGLPAFSGPAVLWGFGLLHYGTRLSQD